MRTFALITLSLFTMLVSCKCKKAATEMTSSKETTMEKTNANLAETKNVDLREIKTVNTSENTNVKQETGTFVEYEAYSRGYFIKLKYDANQLSYTRERDNNKLTIISLTKTQVDELNGLLTSIKMETLPNLKDPTQKRFYDGAAIAHFKGVKNGKEFITVDFDHGFPPTEIEKLVEKLVSYTEQN